MPTECEIGHCAATPAIIVRDAAEHDILVCRTHWEDVVVSHTLIKDVVNVVDALADGAASLAFDVDSFAAGEGRSRVDVSRRDEGGLPVCVTQWDDLSWVRAGG